ncbi:polysaccharide biosynthesis protein [Dyadobacter sp. 676]|uniref:Polysaccharide biosynthesis protein n=1 Tax=Dyadobacter sp. 676 TaxID=3088362 RepID=A0AAU8FTN8_9BACT
MQTKQHTYPFGTFAPEDLLGREPVVLDPRNIIREMRDRIVMITGAAGTIGSELASQVCTYAPAKVILVDQAETPLHDLDLFLKHKFPRVHVLSEVANITNASRMAQILAQSGARVIFHAAAYKHVPFMERHPYEAIKTNILGTEILADLALSHGVDKFVYISTDKAVKPGSVMGATKRLAEIYLQHLSKEYPCQTKFVVTRFGNVLGSNGSFLLRFAQQIREGGPVTVTHPDAQRYMMTVSEACQLVLEAAATSQGSEILSFDMGWPVKIMDVAKRMIRLSGKAHIEVQFTGLRPGEKLCEEPAVEVGAFEKECGQIKSIPFSKSIGFCMRQCMSVLQEALDSGQAERMVAILKMAIPDYISVNSAFTKLDLKRSVPLPGLLFRQEAGYPHPLEAPSEPFVE